MALYKKVGKLVVLALIFGYFRFTPNVFAETHVSGVIDTNTTWTQTESPYIVDSDVNIANSTTLTIELGVIVKFTPFTRITLDQGGAVSAIGTSVDKIYFTSLADDEIGGDTNGDGNATIPDLATGENFWSGIYSSLENSSIMFNNVVVRYAERGLSLREAVDVSITGSIFEKNFIGIEDQGKNSVNISNSEIINNNNGISISQIDSEPNSTYNVNGLSIHGNNYSGVSYYVIPPLAKKNSNPFIWFANLFKIKKAIAQTFPDFTIDFRNTWWGDASGPRSINNPTGLGDIIEEDDFFNTHVLVDPWLTSDPFEEAVCAVDCFSNVLFLPGIKGSVLESGSDTLWPPTILSFNDVHQLELTDEGESVNDIHTEGILNTFHGTPIYAPFSDFIDSISGDNNLINEWLPLAYDWRFSPETVLEDGIKTTDGTLDVIEKIETLATNSRTGKVTIVAHSMGGLLGKAIIKKLQEEGKDGIIDSFVMVGTPQLGTPQAIGAMLHGDGEGIVPVFIAHPSDMRFIAQNMQSAYDLLPSPKYFDEVLDPVIKFDTQASFTQAWRDFWDPVIDIYSNFSEFVTGQGVARIKPAEDILYIPEILKSGFMTNAENFHNEYDSYEFPTHIRVVQVAGWGIPTAKAVEYKNNHGIPGYGTLFTREGDKTVVYPSAISSVADETYFFNLFDYNDLSSTDTQHRNLLNVDPIQNIIESVVKKEDIIENSFISNNKPLLDDIDDELIVSTYSPVILGVYDQFGNFTGVDPDQDLSADVLSIKEDIPGSTFLYTSESQYIFLPKEGHYDFIYKGTGNGPTTVKVENFTADVVIPIVSYTDIPTTLNTVATFTVQSSTPEDTEIVLDVNGDGEEEIIPADTIELSLNDLLVLIKEKISMLVAKDKLKQNLLKKVSNLEKKIENKKQKNIKILANLGKIISNQEAKGKITTADATTIISLLDVLEAQAEEFALDSALVITLKAKIQFLTIKPNLKTDLLKRVEKLEKKQVLIKTLFNLSKNVMNKAENGKIADQGAQAIVDLLNQIEAVI